MTNADLRGLLEAHKRKPPGCLLTMLTFTSSSPSSCGIVETDVNGVVQKFHEKGPNPPGNCANGALYLFDQPFLDWLEQLDGEIKDFSNDVIPQLLGQIQTWHTSAAFLDIGTPEALKEAQNLIKQTQGDIG